MMKTQFDKIRLFKHKYVYFILFLNVNGILFLLFQQRIKKKQVSSANYLTLLQESRLYLFNFWEKFFKKYIANQLVL